MGTAMSSRLQQSFYSPKNLTNLSPLQSTSKQHVEADNQFTLNKKHSFGTGTSGKLLVSTPTEPLEYSAVALAPTRTNYKWARLALLVAN